MKQLALGTIMVAGLAACGGSDDSTVTPIDSGSGDAAPPSCNPLAAAGMQGCAANEKCTWITVMDAPSVAGVLGCVPNGTAAVGEACTHGAAGDTTGFDTCVAGAYCISGVCSDICGFGGQADSTCATGLACTRYGDLFANGDDTPAYGACNPTCDPLTQDCGAGEGCYTLIDEVTGTVAVCAGAGDDENIHGKVLRESGQTTPIYVNSCAPGFIPRPVSLADSPAYECGGFCKAADVYDGNNEDLEGGVLVGGDGNVNWDDLPANCPNAARSGRAAGAEAETAANAVVYTNTMTGESCKYFKVYELIQGGFRGESSFSFTIGSCIPTFEYSTVEEPWPLCNTLPLESADKMATIADDFVCRIPETTGDSLLRTAIRNANQWQQRLLPKLDRLAPPRR